MAFPTAAWVPAKDSDSGNTDDEDTPKKLDVWMLPQDFDEADFEDAGRDPEEYNRRTASGDIKSPAERDGKQQAATPCSLPSSPTPATTHAETSQPLLTSSNHPISPVSGPSQQATIDDQLVPWDPVDQGHPNALVPYNFDPGFYFQPMQAALYGRQHQPPMYLPLQGVLGTGIGHMAQAPFDMNMMLRVAVGFSPNYQGNISVDENRSVNIPEELNCSLFITGLPPTLTTTELLRGIRDVGRVYAVHINPADPSRGLMNCAAKLNFFDREGAERFYRNFGNQRAGYRLPDYAGFGGANVVWNRVRTAPSDKPRHFTRVLFIAGPEHIANPEFLFIFFSSKFVFQVDEVIDHGANGMVNTVEYRFGSFRAQAEAARMALERELGDQVHVSFGSDPCDVA